MTLRAQPINCTLKRSSDEPSSTDKMIGLIDNALKDKAVEIAPTIRIVDHNVLPGVTSDEGEGDDWPKLRAQILTADILVFGTPVWLGQPSSIAKRVLERMDAFLSETDDQGRMPSYSKVAVVAIVGNEDGAHAISAQLFQALNDVGWTIPAVAACYWVGEAMGSVDFKDLAETPEPVAKTAKMLAANAAHLATLLKERPFPG
ncbi:MAG TPA: NAD(P)H-dependent oxidoreductase [Rhizorhapis sp.]